MSVELESQVLDQDDIEEELEDLGGWEYKDGKLWKRFTWNSFLEVIAFVNRVAAVAEQMDHHPDFVIHYKQVELTAWTHKAEAVTRADIVLCRRIEAVAEEWL